MEFSNSILVMADNRHFMLVVVGETPDELIKKYDNKLTVDPYVVYKFSDAKKYHEKYINVFKNLLDMLDKNDPRYFHVKEQLSLYESEDDIEFYLDIAEGYDIDEETGDAMSTSNPDGKYDGCSIGKNFALPLIDKNGNETYSCRKKDVDWNKIHLTNQEVYAFAWDSVMEGKAPKTDDEKNIYDNMKNRKEYFKHYGSRENYIMSNTSFWGYAFLSEKTGWVELEETVNQFEWVKNFFNRFIAPLGDNDKISIYECLRN